MLRTDDRLLLSEALAPPSGYHLDALVGTTFSLDLAALLSVPLSFTFADWENEKGGPTTDPIASLAAVRRLAERITVFCQPGATAATDQPPIVASWLEEVVVPVVAPGDGVFHPKTWVARYTCPGSRPRYRMLNGSRNLTFDRCWDTVLVLDGEPTPRGGRCEETAPLADFIAALPEISVGSLSRGRRRTITELASELCRVRFDPPEGFTSLRFWPMGIAEHRADPLQAARRRRMLIVSPFLGAGRLSRAAGERGDGLLVSRADEIAKLPASAFADFPEPFVLDEPECQETQDERRSGLRGLHAKLYVADDGWNSHLWTGSANATTGATVDNVEFLVQLDGPRSRIGIDQLMGDGPGLLRAMLQPAMVPESPVEPPLREQLLRELDEAAHRLAERAIEAHATPTGTDTYAVELRAEQPVDEHQGVEIECWPLTGIADRDRQPVATGTHTLARFAGQSLVALSAFFVFELSLARDGESVTSRMMVRADLVGAPDARAEAILRDLLKDPEQVLRLIRALLHLDGGGVPDATVPVVDRGGTSGWRGASGEPPLLELLLTALDRDPTQLKAVRDVLADLAQGEDLLPPGLMEICAPIFTIYEERVR